MTVEEFSLEFDILYNNISSNMAPGLTEREKSIFLTQAQELFVRELYAGNTKGASFESDELLTSYLATLVVPNESIAITKSASPLYNLNEYIGTYNSNAMVILNEIAQSSGNSTKCFQNGLKTIEVIPITHDDLSRTIRNPFRGTTANRVLRISYGESTENFSDRNFTLYSKSPLSSYLVTYLKYPEPIVLETYSDNNGTYTPQTCLLPKSLHRQILVRAVDLAKAVWQA